MTVQLPILRPLSAISTNFSQRKIYCLVSMLSKSSIKLLQSLKLKKHRQKYHLFVAEGHKTIITLLSHGAYPLDQLYASSDWMAKNNTRVNPSQVIICTKEELKKLSSLKSSPEVLGTFKYDELDDALISDLNSVIYLDDVQDPGNVGTIIRIADWYGVDAVIRSIDSADFYNPKVVQSTMGSMGHVRLYTVDKILLRDHLMDWDIIGAVMSSTGASKMNDKSVCLVIGNEGKGISDEVLGLITHHCHIPGVDHRQADSLNAAISAGILAQHIWGRQI